MDTSFSEDLKLELEMSSSRQECFLACVCLGPLGQISVIFCNKALCVRPKFGTPMDLLTSVPCASHCWALKLFSKDNRDMQPQFLIGKQCLSPQTHQAVSEFEGVLGYVTVLSPKLPWDPIQGSILKKPF